MPKAPHTEVKVPKLPKCDFCSSQAHYDGKTRMGPWAWMCPAHFRAYGIGLGLGRGQKLILSNPVQVKPGETCYFCAIKGTAKKKPLFWVKWGQRNVPACVVCIREGKLGLLERNPDPISDMIVAGLGLGVGFKAVDWAAKRVGIKNPTMLKKYGVHFALIKRARTGKGFEVEPKNIVIQATSIKQVIPAVKAWTERMAEGTKWYYEPVNIRVTAVYENPFFKKRKEVKIRVKDRKPRILYDSRSPYVPGLGERLVVEPVPRYPWGNPKRRR